MNENKIKSIINDVVGFDKKFIEIGEYRTNMFGGLVWCRFTVKGEAYRIKVTETGGCLFDFDLVDEQGEDNVSRETSEAVAPAEA